MKIGIMPPLGTPIATPAYVRRVAKAAEDLGFHSMWAPEHVVLFEEYSSRYPYTADGRLAVAPGRGIIDPFAVLTFAAAVTDRIRLGTGICLVPQRNPVYTAKEVASLDWLSNGRFDFGIGIGWLAEEFAALQVPWAKRAQRTREYLEVMQALWQDGLSEYHGDFYDLPACRQEPNPIQSPHPPFVFGGESEPALRRVAEVGQGWFGFDLDPEEAADKIGHLTVLLEQNNRSRAQVEVSVCPLRRPASRALVEAYQEAGVDQVIFVMGGRDSDDVVHRLEGLAKEVVGNW
ncbi:MAG: LLM class F420-dependent oxidoreductase [Dehalococcoidia bacterium]